MMINLICFNLNHWIGYFRMSLIRFALIRTTANKIL